MYEKELVVQTEEGLHARPAAEFVKVAAGFKDIQISVTKEDKEVNAKSMLGVLSLGASKGTVIKIKAEGSGEKEAVEALYEVLSK